MVVAEMFQGRNWNPYRIPLRLAAFLFLLSLLLHFSLLIFASKKKLFPEVVHQAPTLMDVQLYQRPAVDTLQETAKEKPKDAHFESSRNLKADEDTSPDRAPTSQAQKMGKLEKPVPQTKPKVKKTTAISKNLMSITQEEMLEKGEIQKETLRGDGGNVDSTGFAEKLRKGAELKISAMESDYGQYVTRMKRKISQQWSPQRTLNARMYNFNEIRVDVAVVLDDRGEIVDLRVIQGSFFPEYDAETRRAIRDAAPFPNPPKSLIQADDHLIYMPWSFTVFMNQSGAYVE
ncbi:MAG: TonB family protein [Bacteriovoracaceae bacterium]|nr:TonB family protein [Bacteriovoracaceae bacterium]